MLKSHLKHTEMIYITKSLNSQPRGWFYMQAEALHECFACERSFKASDSILAGVSIHFSEQYCSKACEDEFEQYLASETKLAEELGLAAPAEIKLTEDAARKIINQFHLKLSKEK